MKNKYWIVSLLVFILFLIVFEIIALRSERITFLFGSPFLILKSLYKFSLDFTLPYDFIITGIETILGFMIGAILGTLAGFLLWYSQKIAKITYPYIFVLGVVPIFAFAPIIVVWLGIGLTMKIVLSALGVFLITLTQSYNGAQSISEEEFKHIKSYGATRRQILQKIIFPASLNWVFSSLKMSIGAALLGSIIGEFIAAQRGLGHFMFLSGSFYDIPSIFAGGIYLIILALLLNLSVKKIENNRRKIIHLFSVDRKLKL